MLLGSIERQLLWFRNAEIVTRRGLKLALIQVPRFDIRHPVGGAEVVLRNLVIALARRQHDVTVICGREPSHAETGGRRVALDSSGASVTVCEGFELTEATGSHGVISPEFSAFAHAALSQADVAIVAERALALPTRVPIIVMLGGVGLPHTLDLLASGEWDGLVVPSERVAQHVLRVAPGAARLRVVSNGVDTSLFCPLRLRRSTAPGPLHLLLPARPTEAKGVRRALDVVSAVERQGIEAVLTCLDQRGPLPGSASQRDPRLQTVEWVDHESMPDLYCRSRLTLCLSSLDEGFGLAAVESVACGTPVLVSPRGNLPHLLPRRHGIFVADPDIGSTALEQLVRLAITEGPTDCLERGREAIETRYPIQRMADDLEDLCLELTDSTEHLDR